VGNGLIRYGFFLTALCTMVGVGAWPVQAESFARISDIQGSLNLKGGDDENWTSATLNLLLKEEDRLETGDEASAELEMPGMARIQVGSMTTVEIQRYGGSDRRDEMVLENGGVFIEDRNGTTVVETESAAVSPNSGSTVRVDIDRDGTRVRVATGSAQIQPFTDGEYALRPMLLSAGEEMVLNADSPPEGPRSYYAEDDALERYRRERIRALGLAQNGRDDERRMESNLDQPLMGSDELARNGQWISVEGQSVWRPHVAAGWRPYFNGYWAWYNSFGWTWISYDPFGYVTFHYGGWIYNPMYGWCWVPGYTWRPAYVSWVAFGPYYGWAPLDPFGRVVVANGIDIRIFTVAPKRVFSADSFSDHSSGRRFIPSGMRTNGAIRVADARMFQDSYPLVPIKDINASQPVRRGDGSKFNGEGFAAKVGHPNLAEFPRPARSVAVETHRETIGRSPFSRQSGGEFGPTGSVESPREFPKTGRSERTARNESETATQRGPGLVQRLSPSATIRGTDTRSHPSAVQNRLMRYSRTPSHVPSPSAPPRSFGKFYGADPSGSYLRR